MATESKSKRVILTIKDNANKWLIVFVKDFPQCKGFLRSFRQYAEQHRYSVVRGKAFSMYIPVNINHTYANSFTSSLK